MSAEEIPEECLNDPRFRHHLLTALCSEIKRKEKIIADGEIAVKKSAENISKAVNKRKMLQKMIEAEKLKRSLLEPTFESSNRLVAQQTTQLALVAAQLDEKSLREKEDIEKFRNVVQKYKTTKETRQAEYEAIIPLAAERHQAKVQLQKLEIQKMVLIQKTEEIEKKKEQKRQIDERQLQVELVELAALASNRSKMQEKLKSMDEQNLELARELEALKRQKEREMRQKEEEEREKLRARQLMPPPRLDMSVFSTLCPTSNTGQKISRAAESCITTSSDGDNLSINTAILEDMCRDDEQLMDMTDDDENDEIPQPQPPARSITMILSNQSIQNKNTHESPEKIESLEECCSQLSLEDEDDDSPGNESPINSPIEVQAIVEPLKPKDSPVRKPTSILKTQSILRKPKETMEMPGGPPEEKKAKVNEKKKSSVKSIEDRGEQSKELLKITSVETVRPANVGSKPLVAEVTPTLSNLFSPRHYAPSSCASVDDLDGEFDGNAEDTPGLPNQINWANFSPPQALVSDSSFTSEASAFKPISANDEQPANADSNFLSMFNKGSKSAFNFLFNK